VCCFTCPPGFADQNPGVVTVVKIEVTQSTACALSSVRRRTGPLVMGKCSRQFFDGTQGAAALGLRRHSFFSVGGLHRPTLAIGAGACVNPRASVYLRSLRRVTVLWQATA